VEGRFAIVCSVARYREIVLNTRRVIAVANPELIPGGVDTVHKAIRHYLKEDEYLLVVRHIKPPYIFFSPRSGRAITGAVSYYADEALKKCAEAEAVPDLSVAFMHGKAEWFGKRGNHLYAAASEKLVCDGKVRQGGCGYGSSTYDGRTQGEALTLEVLTVLLRYRLSKKH
jgi:hypothetical protein